MSLVSKEELAQRGMNRSFILMPMKAEHKEIDVGEIVDVVAGDSVSFFSLIRFSQCNSRQSFKIGVRKRLGTGGGLRRRNLLK